MFDLKNILSDETITDDMFIDIILTLLYNVD